MRAIYKTILYRIVTTILTFTLTYLILRELWIPTLLTLIHEGAHSIIYYIFERKL